MPEEQQLPKIENGYMITTNYDDTRIIQELTHFSHGEAEKLTRWMADIREEGIRRALIALGWRPPEALNNESKWTSTPPGVSKWEGWYWCKRPDGKIRSYEVIYGNRLAVGQKSYQLRFSETLEGRFDSCQWFGPLEIPEDDGGAQ